MRPPPPLSEIGRFPVVGGTALLALGATIAWKATNANMEALADGPQIAMGEYWRLVTSILLHADAFHLLFNLYWLWVFGSLIESVFGHVITFAIIVLLAVGSSAAEYAFLEGGVGLSGVGYGFFGMLWILSRYDRRFEDAVDKNTAVLFIGWFFLCIAMTEAGVMAVANVAHGAGAGLGVLLGLAIGGPKVWRIPAGAGLAILLVGSVLGATVYRISLNVSPDRGHAEAALGYQMLESGDNEGAERLYRLALVYQPKNFRWMRNLGVALYREGREKEAREMWDQEEKVRGGPSDLQRGED